MRHRHRLCGCRCCPCIVGCVNSALPTHDCGRRQAIADMVIDDTHIASGTILAISTIYSRAVDQKVSSQGMPALQTGPAATGI